MLHISMPDQAVWDPLHISLEVLVWLLLCAL